MKHNIELYLSSSKDKKIIKNLLQYYVYDFSEFTGSDLNLEGKYNLMPDLDDIWDLEEVYKPFFVKMEDKIVGFVIVKRDFDMQHQEIKHFFIFKKYRKHGIGKELAYKVFDMYKGSWKVSELMTNKPSQIFWTRVINDYTKGNYKDNITNDRRIQTFVR